jgi:hypothetical protein
MTDHFAPQHSSPTAWAQMQYLNEARQILVECRMRLEAKGEPPMGHGFDYEDTIATLAGLTPPVASEAMWRAVDREAREREETL